MRATLRILTSIVGPLLLATGLLAVPAQADPAPATAPYKCQPYQSQPRDYTCDGLPDLLAQDSHGTLWIYPGNGDRGFKPRIKSGTGWHYTKIIASPVVGVYGGVFARDKAGTLWSIPSNGHGAWLKPTRIGGGWNQMSSIIDEYAQFDLLAIDHSGALWRYPYRFSGHTIHWLPRQRVAASGWAGRMLVKMEIGTEYPDFYARDTRGTLWPYFDDGKTVRRAAHSFGSGWGGYTRIVSDGDFENVDGYLDLLATDVHGDLWFYPSTSGGTAVGHRVKIGHGWEGFAIW